MFTKEDVINKLIEKTKSGKAVWENTSDRQAALSLMVVAILATTFTVTAMVLYPEMHSKIFRIFFIAFALVALLLNRFRKSQEEPSNESAQDYSEDDVDSEFDDLGMTEFWWE